jgi:hypothetical protein
MMVQPNEVKTSKWRLGRIAFFCSQSMDDLSSIFVYCLKVPRLYGFTQAWRICTEPSIFLM